MMIQHEHIKTFICSFRERYAENISKQTRVFSGAHTSVMETYTILPTFFILDHNILIHKVSYA